MPEVRPIDANKTIFELRTLPEQERLEYMGVYDLLKSIPTLDYELVVRCKDCIESYISEDKLLCQRFSRKIQTIKVPTTYTIQDYFKLISVEENHFCNYGVKKG